MLLPTEESPKKKGPLQLSAWIDFARFGEPAQSLLSAVGDHLATIGAVAVGLFAIYKYFQDRRDQRERESDQRFMTSVSALSGATAAEQMGGAVMLRTFLSSHTKRFYPLVFDYAVGIFRARQAAQLVQPQEPLKWEVVQASEEEKSLYQSLVPLLSTSAELLSSSARGGNPQHDAQYVKLNWIRIYDSSVSGVNFSSATIIESEIRNTSARSSVWNGVEALKSYFRNVDFSGSELRGARLTQCGFTECTLDKVEGHGIISTYTHFKSCRLGSADFESIQFSNAVFEDCDLRGVSFHLGIFRKAGFINCDLSGADLDGAKMEEGYFRNCSFAGANLTAIVLDRAILSDSDFTGVNFRAVNTMYSAQMKNVRGVSKEDLEKLKTTWGIQTDEDDD